MNRLKACSSCCAILILAAALGACVTTGAYDSGGEENPESAARYNLELGVSYLEQGRLDLARDKLERALEQDPDSAEVHAAAALMYNEARDYDKAEKHYETAVRLDRENSAVLNSYAVFLCSRDRFEAAEANFLEAARNPYYQTPEVAYANAGVCARRLGEPEKAERYFRESLDANPRYEHALLQMADLSYQQKNYLQARAFLQRYTEATTATAEALWLGVRTERAMGDTAAAENYATRLKSEYPRSSQTRLLLESEHETPNAG
ncbi:MAG: type IV pilus biogenesis/stability protein PilW [Gammaproteobacteria bacterium]